MCATMPRGISNISNVACHLSAAIQILCHSLVPLREALIFLARDPQAVSKLAAGDREKKKTVVILVELGRLLQSLLDDEDSNPTESVDPSRFFFLFRMECNANDLGDATTALSALLRTIRSIFVTGNRDHNSESCHPIEHLAKLYKILLQGAMKQQITGQKRHRDSIQETNKHRQIMEQRIIRNKVKSRPVSCPFPVDALSAHSLQQALDAALQPTSIEGYNWETTTDFVESTTSKMIQSDDIQSDVVESLNHWETQKRLSFQSTPLYMLLHLQRFICSHGELKPSENSLHIPLKLEVPVCANNNDDDQEEKPNDTYEMLGGILHLEERDEEDDAEDEGGHYLTLVRTRTSPEDTMWHIVNDETVKELSEEEVQAVLDAKGDNPKRATLLVYRKEHHDLDTAIHRTLQDFKEDLSSIEPEEATEECPWDLVGKRLKILWAKGKYYSGRVTSYHETTGKHRVEYDDGDIKQYKLHKKTIQWEDN